MSERERSRRFSSRERKQQNGFPSNRVLSCYITDFSEEVMEADIWKEMMKHGKVIDVFIAKKRNKVDKRFGFVRFLDVKNLTSFLGSVKITEVKSSKMITSLARFERKNSQIGGGAYNHNNQKKVSVNNQEVNFKHGSGSYADVLRRNNSDSTVRLESSPMIWEWAKCNLIGRVSSYTNLLNIEDLKNADGCSDITFRYIGGLHVLIELDSEMAAKDFLLKCKDVWSNWFVDLFTWDKSFIVTKRLAALKICGLPPNSWNTGAFDKIAKVFGEVVISEECSRETRNWDMGKVVVLTNESSKIERTLKVIIDNVECSARVFEDMFESARLIPGPTNSPSSNWSGSESGTEITSEEDSDSGSFRDEEFGECSPEKMLVDRDSDRAPVERNEVSGEASKTRNFFMPTCLGECRQSIDIPVVNPQDSTCPKDVEQHDYGEDFNSNVHVNSKEVCVREKVVTHLNKDCNLNESLTDYRGTNGISISNNEESEEVNCINLDRVDFTSPINLGLSFRSKGKQKLKNLGNGLVTVNKRKSGVSSRAGIDLNKIAGSHFSHMISNSCKSGSLSKNVGKNYTNNSSSDDLSQVAPNLVNPIIDKEMEAEEQIASRAKNKEIQEEAIATINIGELLGFQLDNHHELVENLIRGEKAQTNNQ